MYLKIYENKIKNYFLKLSSFLLFTTEKFISGKSFLIILEKFPEFCFINKKFDILLKFSPKQLESVEKLSDFIFNKSFRKLTSSFKFTFFFSCLFC